MRSGFTLIEIIVVFALVSFVALLTLSIDPLSYELNSFGSEVDTIAELLQTAREDALANIDQLPHGVALHPPDHPNADVLFEGSSYANRVVAKDEVISGSFPLALSSTTPTEVVFSQVSGDSNFEGDLLFSDPQTGAAKVISLNHVGRISW